MRRILHLDMDAFFAAVEQKRRPELIGKPVVIGGSGDPTRRGVVSTASYEARKFGIHSAMPLRTAHKLCPHAVFLPVDYREYSRVSKIFKDILRQVSPIFEDMGIDEAFLDLSNIERSSGEIAAEIKFNIREAVGITCSIGIAPNKLLAKLASDMQKPDGLTIIAGDDIESRIHPMPARKLWGVGPKTETHLKEIGINTIGELAAQPLEKLTEYFGRSYGQYLHEAARGIDESPLVTHWEPKSSSREITFQRDFYNRRVIVKTIVDLVKEICEDIAERGYKGRNITVKLRFSDFETHTRVKTVDHLTSSPDEIKKAAFDCLRRFEIKKRIRLIGVKVGGLEKG